MQKIFHFLVVVLISSVKFIGGPTIVYMNEKYDSQFGFVQANIACIMGGMLGVMVMIYFSKYIKRIYRKLKKIYKNIFSDKQNKLFSPPEADISEEVEIHYDYVEKSKEKKKIFSRRSRRIVRIWIKYGLVGIAAFTPILFSIPLGTFIMTRLESNRRKIIFYMFISITSWSLILTTLFEITQAHYIQELIK